MAWRSGSSKVSMPASRSWWKARFPAAPAGRAEMADGELRHPDIVQPGGDGHGFLPVRQPQAVAQIDGLLRSSPLATTWYFAGAVTTNSLVALSEG